MDVRLAPVARRWISRATSRDAPHACTFVLHADPAGDWIVSRFPLQLVTALLALIPIATGIVTLLGIRDPIYRRLGLPSSPILDSNLRFFGGIWLGLGLAMLWLVPTIEHQGVLFRALWMAVFLGGVGRLLSWIVIGAPPVPFIGFTLLELVGSPLFIYWQYRIAQSFGAP
jgi:Domain of unknown function (DUF4345)